MLPVHLPHTRAVALLPVALVRVRSDCESYTPKIKTPQQECVVTLSEKAQRSTAQASAKASGTQAL